MEKKTRLSIKSSVNRYEQNKAYQRYNQKNMNRLHMVSHGKYQRIIKVYIKGLDDKVIKCVKVVKGYQRYKGHQSLSKCREFSIIPQAKQISKS